MAQQEHSNHDKEFAERVARTARRRIASRRAGRSVLSWLGAFGVIGWSVAIPTLIGVAIGIWLDERFPGDPSWTLTLMIVGLASGLLIAWGWIRREGRDDR